MCVRVCVCVHVFVRVCVCVCVYMPGAGHEWGGLEVQLHNCEGKPLRVLYLDMVPWFVRIYLHTLRIEAVGEEGNPLASSDNSKTPISGYGAFTSNMCEGVLWLSDTPAATYNTRCTCVVHIPPV